MGDSTTKLTNVSLVEPDPTLFMPIKQIAGFIGHLLAAPFLAYSVRRRNELMIRVLSVDSSY
jgi:hypothetical protein